MQYMQYNYFTCHSVLRFIQRHGKFINPLFEHEVYRVLNHLSVADYSAISEKPEFQQLWHGENSILDIRGSAHSVFPILRKRVLWSCFVIPTFNYCEDRQERHLIWRFEFHAHNSRRTMYITKQPRSRGQAQLRRENNDLIN